MKIDFEIDVTDLGSQLGRSVTARIASGVDEAFKYGSLGRALKEAAEKAGMQLAAEVLADPAFRSEARKALARGVLRGIEAKGERIAKGMPLQAALELAAPGVATTPEKP